MFSHYPSTEQFRHVIISVKKFAAKRNEELPTLKFVGTVKLHGSNAAIGFQKDSGHWIQSRNNVITPLKDFKACAKSISPVADEFFTELVLPKCPAIREQYELGRKILIFGEWCGENIQKNVAIFGLPKMFVIFNVQVCEEIDATSDPVEIDDDGQLILKSTCWLQPKEWSHIKWHEKLIYNIHDFQTYEIEINFECPQVAQNKLVEITETVETQCPVGSYFNRPGLGEGVVWTEWEKSNGALMFKVKGEKHSVTKVTTLAPVDTEQFLNIQNFIVYACTENRMHQGLDYLREQQLAVEMKNFVVFMRWVVADIVKEEKDTMDASGVSSTDVGRTAKNRALPWFKNQLS